MVNRSHLVFAAAASCALLVPWLLAAHHICKDCYRIGNFLDFWLQRELLYAATGELQSAQMQQTLYGIHRGVVLRRVFRFRPHRSLLEHAYAHRTPASLLPSAAQWRTDATLVALLPRLRASNTDLLWKDKMLLARLEPHVRAALRELLASYASHTGRLSAQCSALAPSRHVAANHSSSSCCVVHMRVGQPLFWSTNRSRGGHTDTTKVHQLSRAAAHFRAPPRCFHILDGGTHHLCTQSARGDDCGASARGVLVEALRAAFPTAAVHEPSPSGPSPDDDFLTMACARTLLLGGGSSYNTFAALAAHADVRGLSVLGSRDAAATAVWPTSPPPEKPESGARRLDAPAKFERPSIAHSLACGGQGLCKWVQAPISEEAIATVALLLVVAVSWTMAGAAVVAWRHNVRRHRMMLLVVLSVSAALHASWQLLRATMVSQNSARTTDEVETFLHGGPSSVIRGGSSPSGWRAGATIRGSLGATPVPPWAREGVLCDQMQRLGALGDGGKMVCVDRPMALDDTRTCVVISVGSRGDFSFESAVHRRWPHCEIHTFDGTRPEGATWDVPSVVHFHAANFNVTSWRPWRHRRQAGTAPHGGGHGVALLKMDCDGCEYTALPPFLEHVCVEQLLLEVHRQAASGGALVRLLKTLNRTHGAFYAEPNVFGAPPGTCMEIALRRRRHHRGASGSCHGMEETARRR